MIDASLSIGELADAAGVTRRTVRFYVQRGLLEAPHGRGRGSRYSPAHLERLRRIQELQAAGHSLEAVRRVLEGRERPRPMPSRGRGPRRSATAADLYTRFLLAEGVELHVDSSRHDLPVEALLALRDAVAAVLDQPDGPFNTRRSAEP